MNPSRVIPQIISASCPGPCLGLPRYIVAKPRWFVALVLTRPEVVELSNVTRVALDLKAKRGGRFKGQPHIELCAIGTRAEVDFSVMSFNDDPVTDDQAESRA